MKTILIIAAILIGAASIYGFVDYNKKSGTKEFKQLYVEKKSEPVQIQAGDVRSDAQEVKPEVLKKETEATISKKTKPEIEKKEKKATPMKKAIKKNSKKLRLKEFSRGKPQG